MGPWVMINAGWYKVALPLLDVRIVRLGVQLPQYAASSVV